MLRFAELVLFVAPFVLFAVWRLMAFEGRPSVRVLIGTASALLVLAGILVWLSEDAALPPGSDYEPARLLNGQVIAGHAASK